jgi:protein-arginine kinase activator protein McsA
MECYKCKRSAKDNNIKLMPVDYSNVGEKWICTDCFSETTAAK